MPMGAVILGVDASQVAVIAPAVNAGIAVEHFLPVTSCRQTDAIGNPEDRCEVENDQQPARQVAALPDVGKDAVLGVGTVDPIKPVEIIIAFPQPRFGSVKS